MLLTNLDPGPSRFR
jgi:hypothetical protein